MTQLCDQRTGEHLDQHLDVSTLMPLVSSSSKEPMSKASAAFTSPRGGIKGGEYWGAEIRHDQRRWTAAAITVATAAAV